MTIGTRMVSDGRTARQIFEDLMAQPIRAKFGFGAKLAIVNVDFQNAYTRIDEFKTAYETDPDQIAYVNTISALARARGMPVIWTHVAYMDDAADAGVWGTRTDTPDSLQNIKYGSRRYAFDERCEMDTKRDAIYTKRMPSAFFETPLQSLLVWHKVDTVVVTGGSTSGCVRATAVESLSRGYRTIVPIETCADKHESYHFANLTDLQLKYADVEPVQVVIRLAGGALDAGGAADPGLYPFRPFAAVRKSCGPAASRSPSGSRRISNSTNSIHLPIRIARAGQSHTRTWSGMHIATMRTASAIGGWPR